MKIYEEISPIVMALFTIFGIIIGFTLGFCRGKLMEIQDIKQVDNGYYITINNEIYYKE
jgi:hypothetical protein